APLLGDVTLLGVAELAQDRLELLGVELAGPALEARVLGDAPRHLGVRDAEPHGARALVERGLLHPLSEHLLVETAGARLVGRDGAPQLASGHLQLVVVELAELLDRDLAAADGGDRLAGEAAAEDVADAPDPEGNDQEPDHDCHDKLAEPTGGGGA